MRPGVYIIALPSDTVPTVSKEVVDNAMSQVFNGFGLVCVDDGRIYNTVKVFSDSSERELVENKTGLSREVAVLSFFFELTMRHAIDIVETLDAVLLQELGDVDLCCFWEPDIRVLLQRFKDCYV